MPLDIDCITAGREKGLRCCEGGDENVVMAFISQVGNLETGSAKRKVGWMGGRV